MGRRMAKLEWHGLMRFFWIVLHNLLAYIKQASNVNFTMPQRLSVGASDCPVALVGHLHLDGSCLLWLGNRFIPFPARKLLFLQKAEQRSFRAETIRKITEKIQENSEHFQETLERKQKHTEKPAPSRPTWPPGRVYIYVQICTLQGAPQSESPPCFCAGETRLPKRVWVRSRRLVSSSIFSWILDCQAGPSHIP